MRSKKIWFSYLPFIATLAFYLVVKETLQGSLADAESPYGVLPYLMSEAKVFLMYLRLLVLPMNQNADYYLPPAGAVNPLALVSALLVAATLFLLYSKRRKYPVPAFFGLWFFLAIAPESSFVPIADIAEEYRLYLPSVGFIAAMAALGAKAVNAGGLRRQAVAAVILMFAVLTFSRNAVWATESSLWGDAVKKAPYSPRAHSILGNTLFSQGRYVEAIGECNKALAIDPVFKESYTAYNNIGMCLYNMKRPEEAAIQFEKAVGLNPGSIEAYQNLGAAQFMSGRYKEAVDTLVKATIMQPGYVGAHISLSECYTNLGEMGEALTQLQTAAGYAPKDFDVRLRLAKAYEQTGNLREALGQAEVAAGLAGDEKQRGEADEIIKRIEAR